LKELHDALNKPPRPSLDFCVLHSHEEKCVLRDAREAHRGDIRILNIILTISITKTIPIALTITLNINLNLNLTEVPSWSILF